MIADNIYEASLYSPNISAQSKPGQFINLPYYGSKRRALNVDGTPFKIDDFLQVVEANLVSKDQLKIITSIINKKCANLAEVNELQQQAYLLTLT